MSSIMTSAAGDDLPVAHVTRDPELSPYWDAARAGRLVMPRCTQCGTVQALPRSFCPQHPQAAIEWIEASGRGTVYTFTRVHKGEGAFATATPYVVAYVELDEGPRVLTNLVGPLDALAVGAPVEAVFDQRSESGAVLRFHLYA